MDQRAFPNFFVIGAPKAATSSLCFYLAQHPQVAMSEPKEPFFFCEEKRFNKGWSWYAQCFDHVKGEKAVGEGSTVYCQTGTYPKSVERIAEYMPHAKIIYIVREPFTRLESMWIELHSQGKTMLPFNRALRADPQYLDSALYWKSLNAYRTHFPDDQILVLFYEDYKADPNAVLGRCFEFLSVDSSVQIEGAHRPRYTSVDKRRDLPFTNLIRKAGIVEPLRDHSPRWLRELAKRALKREISDRPRWEAGTARWVYKQIEDDIEQFLSHVGKPIAAEQTLPYTGWPYDFQWKAEGVTQ
jgi:hypothetical protein